LESGYFPELWKTSLITPLAKVSNPNDYCDLRPISIIPVISKVLEKFIQPQIYDFFISNNIIPHKQSGFRKQHSTTSVLLNVTNEIISALDRGDSTALVMLDFSKAFDTLDHNLLLAKLKYYGFDETSVSFFRSYLSERKQRVVLEGQAYSNTTYITSGVPQGSVLGPILFLVYVADMFKMLKHCDIQGFADDTQIFHSFKANAVLEANNKINEDLSLISTFSINNNLKLNPAKCFLMCFSSKNKQTFLEQNLKLFVGGTQLKLVESSKNLGLILDKDLRFKTHISNVIKKSYFALKPLYANKSIINYKMRKKLCESLVFPIMNYCNIVYFPCLDKITIYRLQKLQNQCCRFIFNLRKFDRVSKKISELGWLRVDNVFTHHIAVFVHKLLRTSSPAYLSEKLVFRKHLHNVNLRFINKLEIPRYRSAFFRRSFLFNAVSVYNKIPSSLKCMPSIGFRKKLKFYLLNLQNAVL